MELGFGDLLLEHLDDELGCTKSAITLQIDILEVDPALVLALDEYLFAVDSLIPYEGSINGLVICTQHCLQQMFLLRFLVLCNVVQTIKVHVLAIKLLQKWHIQDAQILRKIENSSWPCI